MRFRRSTVAATALTAVGLVFWQAEGVIAPCAAALPPAPAGVTIAADLPYLTPDRAEKLDLYLPSNRPAGTRSPGVVIIHGGGWVGGTKSASREFEVGTMLAKAGYVCVSVEYRMTAQGRWPTNVQDCKNGVRFLRKNAEKYGVDVDHIGVIGGSAGGHLALMVGVTDGIAALAPPAPYPGVSDRVQAIVDMYGIAEVHNPKSSVFGDHTPANDTEVALASPMAHLSKTMPPVLILHGTADKTVDISQSIALDKKLSELGVPHQFLQIPGIGHTFDLETWNRKPLPSDLRPVVLAFFDRYLKQGAKTPTSNATAAAAASSASQ